MRAATAQRHKDELLIALRQVRRELLAVASSIPAAKQETPFLGVWSVNDLVAHLAGWDYANLAAIDAVLAGRLPYFYDRFDSDWRTFNAELVARHKRVSLAETIAEAVTSHEALLATLSITTADAIMRDHGVRSPRGRRVTIAMLITAETRDEQGHLAQLRAFATNRIATP